MNRFESTDLSALKILREDYFASIQLPQELFLEWIVAKGKYYKIIQGDESAGYVIISADNMLVEFHLTGSFVVKKEEIFSKTLNQFRLKKAYCKSFDAFLTSL